MRSRLAGRASGKCLACAVDPSLIRHSPLPSLSVSDPACVTFTLFPSTSRLFATSSAPHLTPATPANAMETLAKKKKKKTRHSCLPGEPARLSLSRRRRLSVFSRHLQIRRPISRKDDRPPVWKTVMRLRVRARKHYRKRTPVATFTMETQPEVRPRESLMKR